MRKQYGVEFSAPPCPECGAEMALALSGPWSGPGWSVPTMGADWVCDNDSCFAPYRAVPAAIQDLPLAILADIGARIRQWQAA